MCFPMKTVTVAALLLQSTLAAHCPAGSCIDDATSLVQLKNILKRGGDKQSDVELIKDPDEDEAVATQSSILDDGAVAAAYQTSKRRHSNSATERVKSDLGFAAQMDQQMAENNAKAESEQQIQDGIAQETFDEAARSVQQVAANHEIVRQKAMKSAQLAKEDYEAHVIKKKEVEEAAALGKAAGEEEDQQHAAQILAAHEKAKVKAYAKKKSTEEKKAMKSRRLCEECDVLNEIEKEGNEMASAVAHIGKETKAAEKRARALAATAQKDIEGPEGIRNTVIEDTANRIGNSYGHRAASATRDMEDTLGGEPEDDMVETGMSMESGSLDNKQVPHQSMQFEATTRRKSTQGVKEEDTSTSENSGIFWLISTVIAIVVGISCFIAFETQCKHEIESFR